jgi:hypothetical protein
MAQMLIICAGTLRQNCDDTESREMLRLAHVSGRYQSNELVGISQGKGGVGIPSFRMRLDLQRRIGF